MENTLVRGNNKPHIDHTLRKEIMKRSRLKNVANKTGNCEDISAHKKQRNLVVKLNKEQKAHCFGNIEKNPKQTLLNICKPYLCKTKSEDEYLIILDGDFVASDETIACQTDSRFFHKHESLSRVTALFPLKLCDGELCLI